MKKFGQFLAVFVFSVLDRSAYSDAHSWHSLLSRFSQTQQFQEEDFLRRYDRRRTQDPDSIAKEVERLRALYPAISPSRSAEAIVRENGLAAPETLSDLLQFDFHNASERERLRTYLIEDFRYFVTQEPAAMSEYLENMDRFLTAFEFIAKEWPQFYSRFLSAETDVTGCGPFSEFFGTWFASQGFPSEQVLVGSIHRGRVGTHVVLRIHLREQILFLDLTIGQYTNLALPAVISESLLLALPRKQTDRWLEDFGLAGYLYPYAPQGEHFSEFLDGNVPVTQTRYQSIINVFNDTPYYAYAKSVMEGFRDSQWLFGPSKKK